jgi:squalene monooxygenase
MSNDVIIAGGGVAGSAVAAALGEFGCRVLLIEPGLRHPRRLAGELIHPPGVSDLSKLGLLGCLEQAGGVPVHGFAALPSPHLLPYKDVPGLTPHGLAIEHAIMAEILLSVVSKLPYVTLWRGARITDVDLNQTQHATVTISYEGSEDQLNAKLLVAADGRCSHLRAMAGIRHKQVQLSTMIGYMLKRSRLPHPGFGHVFAGGPSPVLAYELGGGNTRIMFDLPKPEYSQPCVDSLPPVLRRNVQEAMETQTPLRAANYSVVPEAVVKGRMVCVGDAGGCCHPLTATGLSACTRDAMLLQKTLRETAVEIPKALRRYARLREGPQCTRLVSANALYDVFRAQSPEMRLLRQGLFRYWQFPRGRRATMALLSTHEERRSVMVREYLQVFRYALPELIHSADTRSDAMVGLSRALLKFVGEACMGCK